MSIRVRFGAPRKHGTEVRKSTSAPAFIVKTLTAKIMADVHSRVRQMRRGIGRIGKFQRQHGGWRHYRVTALPTRWATAWHAATALLRNVIINAVRNNTSCAKCRKALDTPFTTRRSLPWQCAMPTCAWADFVVVVGPARLVNSHQLAAAGASVVMASILSYRAVILPSVATVLISTPRGTDVRKRSNSDRQGADDVIIGNQRITPTRNRRCVAMAAPSLMCVCQTICWKVLTSDTPHSITPKLFLTPVRANRSSYPLGQRIEEPAGNCF